MIIFAAIVPHPPLIMPSVGKENAKKLKKTDAAFAALEEELYVKAPETLIIISPHGASLKEAMTINLMANYRATLAEFGDFKTTHEFRSDFMLIDKLQRSARAKNILQMSSSEVLDYGTAVPLLKLATRLSGAGIVPIATSGATYKTHYDFGKDIHDELMSSNKRIAVIASADLSHTLSPDAPAGFSKAGAELDSAFMANLDTRNTVGMLSIPYKTAAASHECGVRPVAMLLGILEGIPYAYKQLSYEAPFGVGHLVAHLAIP